MSSPPSIHPRSCGLPMRIRGTSRNGSSWQILKRLPRSGCKTLGGEAPAISGLKAISVFVVGRFLVGLSGSMRSHLTLISGRSVFYAFNKLPFEVLTFFDQLLDAL